MLKNFNEKNFMLKIDKEQIVLYFLTETFRTVFVGSGPPLDTNFS